MQYVGQTHRRLKDRILEHRRSVLQNKIKTPLVTHFSSNNHSIDDMMVSIAEVVPDRNELRTREDFWIRLLNTAYPFGLNDNIAGYGNVTEVNPLEKPNHPYFRIQLPPRKRPPSDRKKNKRRSRQCNTGCITYLQSVVKETDFAKRLYEHMQSQSQRTYIYCRTMIADTKWSADNPQLKTFMLAFLAAKYKPKHRQTPSGAMDRLIIPFLSEGMDRINIKKCFEHSNVRRTLPNDIQIPKIQVVYTYTAPTSRSIFNYSKKLRNISNIDELSIQLSETCDCVNSPFMYQPAGHIITGNLDIIGNDNIRNLLKKGTKFRIPKVNNWNETWDSIKQAIVHHCTIL